MANTLLTDIERFKQSRSLVKAEEAGYIRVKKKDLHKSKLAAAAANGYLAAYRLENHVYFYDKSTRIFTIKLRFPFFQIPVEEDEDSKKEQLKIKNEKITPLKNFLKKWIIKSDEPLDKLYKEFKFYFSVFTVESSVLSVPVFLESELLSDLRKLSGTDSAELEEGQHWRSITPIVLEMECPVCDYVVEYKKHQKEMTCSNCQAEFSLNS